jgi:hypothetical protein
MRVCELYSMARESFTFSIPNKRVNSPGWLRLPGGWPGCCRHKKPERLANGTWISIGMDATNKLALA